MSPVEPIGHQSPAGPVGYQYVVLRCVPRVDREEFVNVAVVVYCQAWDFLRCASHLDEQRLGALGGDLDLAAARSALSAVAAVCIGGPSAGSAGAAPTGSRFGFISAPRSTVIQPGPVHGGLTANPEAQIGALMRTLVLG